MKINVTQGDVIVQRVWAKRLSDDCIYVHAETDVTHPTVALISSHGVNLMIGDKVPVKYTDVWLTEIEGNFSVNGYQNGRYSVDVFLLRQTIDMFESGEVVRWEK